MNRSQRKILQKYPLSENNQVKLFVHKMSVCSNMTALGILTL